MRFRRARTLRFRMLVLVLLAVIPALGMILYNDIQERRVARDQAEQRALALARSAALDQQRLILETRQLLALLSRLEQVRDRPARCSAFVRQLLGQESPYVNFVVTDPQGDVACSALPFEPGLNLSDRAWFRRAVETRNFAIGDYTLGRIVRNVPIITFAQPLLGEGGELVGVVNASVPLTWLQERIAAGTLPPGSAVTVFDPSMVVLARYPADTGFVGRSAASTAMAVELARTTEETTMEMTGLDGVRRLYATRPLLDLPGVEPIRLTVGISTEVAYAPADRALVSNIIGLLLLTAFVGAIAWWASDAFILRQVRSLVRATRQLGSGDLSARAKNTESGGEIGELATSFNEMAVALEQNAREITGHLGRIGRLNRVYAVLSGINSAILRIRSEEALLRDLCRIAVNQGRFRLAMVHRLAPGSETAELAAWSSDGPLTAEDLPATASADDPGSIVGAAAQRKDVVVVTDTAGDECIATWRPLVQSQEYRSVAALPLRVTDSVVGVLTLFAGEQDVFDADELRLLRELAADASLGLQFLENERRLAFAANYDTLTELPNRTLFADRLQQSLATARQNDRHVAVLAVRVNRMAEINAMLGHHVGDVVLRDMAKCLTDAVGEGDTVARLGSGEFGVILAAVTEAEEVGARVDEILEKAPHRITAEGEEVFVTLSIGVAISPMDGDSGPMLIQNATLARQAVIAEVTNSVTFFSADMNTQAQERRRIEDALRRAIEQDELMVYYQPVVDVATRRVIGVESLLRWDSADLGFVSPATFIPVAEETSLIVPIGEWIVASACEQGRQWHGRGFDVRINVNVSVDQLRAPDFVERVTKIIEERSYEPGRLAMGLEITESALMENIEAVIPAIEHFRKMGMAMYIDDFGTGYSSLAYLRQLPIDTLKIDTSFIRDTPKDGNAVAVVSAIIAMAKSLELRVIAEGVETEAQFDLLRELGCDAVQGFLFGKPARPESVERLFDRTL